MAEITNKKFQTLAETFDVTDCVDVPVKTDIILAGEEFSYKPEDSSVDSDTEAVRETLYNLLKHGESAFTDLKRIAVAEESPRSFEVLNSMLSNLSDIAVKLMEIHERKGRIDKLNKKEEVTPAAINNGVVNNNSVFVGTTADLQNALKQLNMKE